MRKTIRAVDLFCGGGGLSVGFDLASGETSFKTVLGVDIEPSAIRIFNDNFKASHESSVGIGRQADLTWFSHAAEIQAFYLTHLAETENDNQIRTELSTINLYRFLQQIKYLDDDFKLACEKICSSGAYSEEIAKIDKTTKTLAFIKSCTAKLGLESLIKPAPALKGLPWAEEYSFFSQDCPAQPSTILTEILDSSKALWHDTIEKLLISSEKTGKGQNSKNSEKTKSLAHFLLSPIGSEIFKTWLSWKASRDSLRASFFLKNTSPIQKIYNKRKIGILLGGPPCKGFSRIGRPVIASLREQGVHAWSHHEYGDERNALMVQYVLFIEALDPDAFIFENVSNFESTLKTPAGDFNAPDLLMELIDNLSTNGTHYHVSHRQLNAKNFSVPQDRRRFIMLGIKSSRVEKAVADNFFILDCKESEVTLNTALWGLAAPFEFAPGNGVSVSQKATAYDYDLDSLESGDRSFIKWIRQPAPNRDKKPKQVDGHIYRRMREDDKAFLKYVAPGIRWMDLKLEKSKTLLELQFILDKFLAAADKGLQDQILTLRKKVDDSLFLRLLLEHTLVKNKLTEQHLLLDGYLTNGTGGHGDWLERLSAGKPSKTVVAHIGKDTYGYFHPYENRAITIREAARIQSFPDFFKFGAAGVVDAYTVIGNAVAPLMANELAQRLLQLHHQHNIFTYLNHEKNHKPKIQSSEQISLFSA